MKGATYYDRNRDAVLARYDALDPAEVHAGWAPAHLFSEPGFACDIGAGSGRDCNWLAARGWEVVAVEPSALRDRAARDSHQRVVWMNDARTDLRTLRALGRRFDLILLSAVWMHVAPKGRERAFRILSELLGPSGLLVITLRLGGHAAENAARGFHDTSAEELIGYANRRAINDACENMHGMPVRHITHPGTANQQLFESGFSRVRATSRPVVLWREYLVQFGRFRIPAQLWQALGQYACWLDPVIVREWRQFTADCGSAANRNRATR